MGEKRGMKGLETWCKRVTNGYPGVKVDNMTTSWRDGLAFCALIHHFRPDLIDFESLNKDDIFGNNELAFRVAEQYLGIPALLDAEDMVEYAVPDRLSILTYLSQFYRTFVGNHQESSPTRTVPKRPATLSERTIVSPVSESPPAKKLPHALSASRREPCARCGLPVFIAERLIVGGHTLYHRSCFRCARCQHQLSLANCYETEDGRYCCETCPDEVGSSEQLRKDATDSPRLGDDTLSVSSENDEYSATFESALEGTGTLSTPLEIKQVSSSSFARSNFMNSQLQLLEPDVSSLNEPLSSRSCSLVSEKPGATEAVCGGDESDTSVQACDKRYDDAIGMLAPTYTDTDISETLLTSSVSVKYSDSVNKDTASGEVLSPVTNTKEPLSTPSSLSIVQMRLKMFEKPSSSDIETDGAKETAVSSNRLSNKIVKNIILEPVSVNSNSMSNDFHVNVPDANNEEANKIILSRDQEMVTKEDKSISPVLVLDKPGKNVDNSKVSNLPEQIDEKQVGEMLLDKKETSSLQNDSSEKHNVQQKVSVKHTEPEPLKILVSPKKIEDTGQTLYPEELNPFGEDDETEDLSGENPEVVTEAVNPNLELVGKPPLPAVRRVVEAPKLNLNPFWSDGEEPNSDEETDLKKTPVPCPRRSKPVTAEMQYEPSPLPRSIGVKVGSITSLSSIGSSASSTPFGTAKRKKKPAPPPPSARELFPKSAESSRTSSPTPSNMQSPQVVRRHRKSRLAPPPPSIVPESKHIKDDKNATNRIRQNGVEVVDVRPAVVPNKSMAGQWKRKKGPAPPRPVPQRRQIRAMPMKEVRQELEDIEVQQLGLERQGVKLEQTIRAILDNEDTDPAIDPADSSFTPDVEDLVLQLFELVNEKNELFRRQAELMYLRRQQRLEEEHADLEYQIRCLLEQPDHSKTDSDKAREEELIQRLVEVVERRNEIVECLEMDRRREVEEDRSIHHQLGIFAAKKKVSEEVVLAPSKEKEKVSGHKGKEDKKKHKKLKEKFAKKKLQEKVDADKDIDEVEQSLTKQGKDKKGKKKWFH